MVLTYPATGGRLQSAFSLLQQYGFQDFFVPFLLFFALAFAILQKVGLFKVKKNNQEVPDRKMNGILAFTFSLLIVVPHVLRMYPFNLDPVAMLYLFLPSTTIAMVVGLMALVMLGLVSTNVNSVIKTLIGVLAAAAVLISVLAQAAPNLIPSWIVFDQTTVAFLIVLAVMGAVVWFIFGGEAETYKTIHEIFGKEAK